MLMNTKKKETLITELISFFMIMVGALLASFSVICILIPNDAIDYGTAGIAIIISKLTGANLSLCVIVVFLPFLIAGFLLLGKQFGLKAAWGSIVYTIGLEIFEEIPFELNTEHFLAVAFGGAILGLGLAIILRNGGCIDGSEIFANILVKKLSAKTGKSFSMLTLLIIFNAFVYMTVFVLINRNSAMLSLLVYVVATVIIDHITGNFEAIKQVTVITKDSDTLVKAIKNELNKTCTIIDSEGAIAGQNKTVICYVNYFELAKIKEIIGRT
ncbi:MAG: YitT family protein, partial [Lachnospiraceae bacterium]|nr:YitT family protein [Lachnospiraceae bacterium]